MIDSGSIGIRHGADVSELRVSTSSAGFVVASVLLLSLLTVVTVLVDDGLRWSSILMLGACFGAFVLLPVRLAGTSLEAMVCRSVDELPGFDLLD